MKFSLQRSLRSKLIIYGIFLLSLVLTLYAYSMSISISKDKYLAEFQQEHQELTETIIKKLHVYEQVLWSGVALFNSSDHVSRAEWKTFSDIVDINEHWPGIQALGYAIALPADTRAEHERLVREEGFAGYAIHPKHERPFYTSVALIEPFDWRNQRAFGYDMWSDSTRRTAMKAAMLSGEAHASGAITLIQETNSDTQQGFLIYTPVYTDSSKLEKGTVKSLDDIQGWVFAPLRINDFMRSIVKKAPAQHQIKIIDVTDGGEASQPAPSYKTLYYHANDASTDLVTRTTTTPIFGRQWQIELAIPRFNAIRQLAKESLFLFILSLCVDILLFVALLSYRGSQLREDQRFTNRYKGLIDSLNEKTANIDKLERENGILENNIETLQGWLQEREVRINELKMNQKDTP
ncbi:MAG TPA: CHASE domain-containing protein [Marinagarivorans sp.]